MNCDYRLGISVDTPIRKVSIALARNSFTTIYTWDWIEIFNPDYTIYYDSKTITIQFSDMKVEFKITPFSKIKKIGPVLYFTLDLELKSVSNLTICIRVQNKSRSVAIDNPGIVSRVNYEF